MNLMKKSTKIKMKKINLLVFIMLCGCKASHIHVPYQPIYYKEKREVVAGKLMITHDFYQDSTSQKQIKLERK